MLKRVKKWLGIEGVKIKIEVPEEISADADSIHGKLIFETMHDQTVQNIRLKLIEKYKRGRRKNKLIDEYILGEVFHEEDIEVSAGELVELEFELPFQRMVSTMDSWQRKNFVFGGIVKTAKLLKGVKSEFRIEVDAKVKGTALNPFSREIIKLA
jgi:hypothetical protein